ncbi:protein RETICULATA-RELATED 1, chloroplastic isoform X1 [Brachypodium distachyon]|uniref:Protein RETICULATA-RELATED 1, chloroplastic n=1 Tax=Brachypodium distachyon TaxID=15368 RepID=I1GYH8_BRADI|nr:protein RETICULATA-RELATED 1, chloroplastic isoform X1 [Brachypodium distachyon]KQK18337.1 hypothetical protein BRADI_1g41797v3 [Brachypodium distachyon]|eukprot:XP_003560744.1 protein RETICULATA-RELATED 1, chloroplastic isoform X1 [Brachypodium distachyon]
MTSAAFLAAPQNYLLSAPSVRPQPRPSARLHVAASSSSSSPPAERNHAAASLERCLSATPAPAYAPTEMKGGRRQQHGAFGAVTLQKAKIDLSHKRLKGAHPELATGGGGGDNGKRIGYGGGNSGDDDGDDDDDYFDDSEDGDEEIGFFRRRVIIQELFNREFVDAVLQEWYKTISNLPAGLRQAHEMGLVSSAQMVQYLSMFGRPTKARYFSRAFPSFFSRGLVGRMLADPSFLHKMTFELLATISSSVWWEMKNRKERFQQEWDLVFLNVFTATVCNLAVFYSLAPCRSYMIQKLPSNIFEKSYPMRQFDLLRRIQSLFGKAAELCLGGLLAGSIQGGLSNVLSSGRERRLSMTVPSISKNALSYGAFCGLYANLRYQMLCGLDRSMANHFDVLGVAVFFSAVIRLLNIQIGEVSRRVWLGEEADLLHSDNLLKTYNGPAADLAIDQQQRGWFISRNAIVSGLELLGIKNGPPEDAPPKPRRKRIVLKK